MRHSLHLCKLVVSFIHFELLHSSLVSGDIVLEVFLVDDELHMSEADRETFAEEVVTREEYLVEVGREERLW